MFKQIALIILLSASFQVTAKKAQPPELLLISQCGKALVLVANVQFYKKKQAYIQTRLYDVSQRHAFIKRLRRKHKPKEFRISCFGAQT